MMKFTNILSVASLLGLSAAHFHVLYPEWRADSLTVKTASQWLFPCKVSPITANAIHTAHHLAIYLSPIHLC